MKEIIELEDLLGEEEVEGEGFSLADILRSEPSKLKAGQKPEATAPSSPPPTSMSGVMRYAVVTPPKDGAEERTCVLDMANMT